MVEFIIIFINPENFLSLHAFFFFENERLEIRFSLIWSVIYKVTLQLYIPFEINVFRVKS